MKRTSMGTRIALVALAALLSLPLAPTASPVEAKKRSRTITRTFANVVPINLGSGPALPSPVSAGYYPSDTPVSGLKGTIRDVNLTLDEFTHTFPDQVEVLLVGPRGQTAIVLADVGGSADVAAVTLRLDDEAAAPLPGATQIVSGAFRPTNLIGGPFNPPAPEVGDNAALSVFDGSNPNGTWRLFVQDEHGTSDAGTFAGGWDIEITTAVKTRNKKKR